MSSLSALFSDNGFILIELWYGLNLVHFSRSWDPFMISHSFGMRSHSSLGSIFLRFVVSFLFSSVGGN